MEKLLFTGGTGFLGRNAMPILKGIYEVTTIGISDKDDLKADFVKDIPQLPHSFDIVLHAAGKAHVYPKTETEHKAFYDVNYQGTINLCKGLELIGVPRAIVFISSMNVYGSKPGAYDTELSRPLIGDTPYADSKIKAEEFLIKWCKEHNVILGILRPGLLAGEGAPGNLGAMINGIRKGAYLSISHGKARKSILMAVDIARLVPLVSKKGGIYNVCDSHHPSFGELELLIAKQLGKRPPISIPLWFAKIVAYLGDLVSSFPLNSKRLKNIITDDIYCSDKAIKELNWHPLDVLENFKI